MPRYVAFLRGFSPQNASSASLSQAFEQVGFTHVTTVLSSGNVVFDASSRSEAAIERRAEDALVTSLGRGFFPIVRSSAYLADLVAREPHESFVCPEGAKRVVSFLRAARQPRVPLPLAADGAYLLGMVDREIFTAYSPNPMGPVFMVLIEKAFGTEVTTRTWETVKKCAKA
jgi:uncharacterized protein (DUF1697 family)